MYKNYSERNFPTPRKEKEVGPSLRGKNIFFGRDWTNKNSRWHLSVLKNIFIDDAAYLGKRMKPLEEIRRFRKSQTAWIQTLVEFDSVRAILTSGQNPHRSMKPKKACFFILKKGKGTKNQLLNSLWGPIQFPTYRKFSHDFKFPFGPGAKNMDLAVSPVEVSEVDRLIHDNPRHSWGRHPR